MFKRIYKTFYYEVFFYIIEEPKEVVVERINYLFTERAGLFKSPNLSGKFVNYPETFYLGQKWWLATIRNFENEPAVLKGVITAVSNTQTKIEIAVRPNSIFLILSLFLLPYGVYHLYNTSVTKEANSLYIALWTLFFVLPFLFMAAKVCSNRLRTIFEKYMNIVPVDKGMFPLTSASV